MVRSRVDGHGLIVYGMLLSTGRIQWKTVDMMQDHDLIRRSLTTLEPLGVSGRVLGVLDPAGAVDAELELVRAGESIRFGAVVKRTVRPSTVALVADRLRHLTHEHPLLLVTAHASPRTAELLRARGISFMDAAGNAYIDTPSLLVSIEGRRPAEFSARKTPDRIGVAALQVMFVLLRDPDARTLSVRELGARAGVSHGAAAKARHAFDRRGWIVNLGREGYRLTDPEGLLEAWLVGFSGQLAASVEIARAMSPGALSPASWAKGVAEHLAPDFALLGGEAAAELAGHGIRGETASVWVSGWDADTMRRLRLVPTRDGKILVYRAFAPGMGDPADARLADPLLVLAELAAIPDERLDETRDALRALVTRRLEM